MAIIVLGKLANELLEFSLELFDDFQCLTNGFQSKEKQNKMMKKMMMMIVLLNYIVLFKIKFDLIK